MVSSLDHVTCGIAGLDRVYKGLRAGDNVVFRVKDVDDYAPLARPFAAAARAAGRRLIYFRFARHAPLLDEDGGMDVITLQPETGFEAFVSAMHREIERAGRGAHYVFDCLSDLAVDWYSDEMVGNFFMLTCPYLFDLATVAYFSLLRNFHSDHATVPILETTQLFSDVYRHGGDLYIHPRKVQQRFSSTMHMLHRLDGDSAYPVTDSVTTAEILGAEPWPGANSPVHHLDVWNRSLLRAEEVLRAASRGECSQEQARDLLRRLLRMAVTRDERILAMAERYLTIEDVLAIGQRMIGTGLIGGKAVGVVLARAILRAEDARWNETLEFHDSFFVASDVFYTYLVRNGIWWARLKQRNPDTLLDDAEKARQRIMTGHFPAHLQAQFANMLDYFGQSPIIVRSSSLLEDNFGNSFVGKYDSVFCPNQGSREQRMEDFLSAARTVYASTMSEKALRYRARRGILHLDEQMSLLVQRVSGRHHGTLFYPDVAGVGFSFNPYVWREDINPREGVLRIVFGLGTRAVERADNDYTRVVSLGDPERRPETGSEEKRRYAQRRVDVLDLDGNQLSTLDFEEVAARAPQPALEYVASRDHAMERMARELGVADSFPWVLTFDTLFRKTSFVQDMSAMLQTLHRVYDYPVDIEFTANFTADGRYRINLVQCRPLQVKEGGPLPEPPEHIPDTQLVLRTNGPLVGQSRLVAIDRIVYVVPAEYFQLSASDRVSVARLIGRIMRCTEGEPPPVILLMGPGRWGTAIPSLGVPVTFAEINTVSVLCEVVVVTDDAAHDVSLGTHFFSELVEQDILYMAVFPQRQGAYLDRAFFERSPNALTRLVGDSERWESVVRVIEAADVAARGRLMLCANSIKQRLVCYFETGAAVPPPAAS